MAAYKSSLARAGTMEITADEGISYLKASQKHTLLRFQGLVKEDKPATPRVNSMNSTVKEAELFLGRNKLNPDAQTRGQQKRILEQESVGISSSAKKIRLAKNRTMTVTANESKTLLEGKKLGSTRRETIMKKKAKSNLKKTTTTAMARTLEEALSYVIFDNPNVNEGLKTRSNSLDDSLRYSVKRLSSMQKTALDGKAFLRRSRRSRTQ